ncbi:sel1 repeat family protein [Arcobacter lacus]|uniref:tetratricopeptide repeat protein n=1 Tax=Arcobacter lacus TaxID=1912876 RepID=UPI0021BB1787|nr:tetratricopeptide repeat protein [Arcobacter lacus]MCT7909721.1 sel1 repeat family protein [Arcobacter lacus]
MKKIVIGLIFSIFFGLSLLGDNVDLGIEFANKGNFSKANELWKKLCDDGNAIGCHNLGILYANGRGAKQDYFKANELYKKACDGGYNKSCFNLGISYYNGEGIKQDTQKAKELFGKACDLGLQEGCSAYAKLHKQ